MRECVTHSHACDCREQEFKRLSDHLDRILFVVKSQAENEALWAVPAEGTQSIAEAYLQKELRRLHRVIESVILRRI